MWRVSVVFDIATIVVGLDVGGGVVGVLGVGEVDAFVDSVRVGLGSDETESHNERVGVHLVEFGEERNRATHSVSARVHAIEEVFA